MSARTSRRQRPRSVERRPASPSYKCCRVVVFSFLSALIAVSLHRHVLADQNGVAFVASLFGYLPARSVRSDGRLLRVAAVGAETSPSAEGDSLVKAAAAGDLQTVTKLLSDGVSADSADSKNGQTALVAAAAAGHLDVVAGLLEGGGDADGTNWNGVTPLVAASHYGHDLIVDRLFAAGVSVDAATNSGATALVAAAEGGQASIVERLLAEGAVVDRICAKDATPMVVAAQEGHVGVVQKLLAAGANIDHPTDTGATALMFAAQRGYSDVVAELLDAGAEANCTDQRGATALIQASQQGHFEVVALLVGTNSSIDARRTDGVTALMMASQNGHVPVVGELLAANCSIEAQRDDNGTALLFAAMNGHEAIVDRLIAAGANVDHQTNSGATAIKLAAQGGFYAVVQRLQGKGASGTIGAGRAVDINSLFERPSSASHPQRLERMRRAAPSRGRRFRVAYWLSPVAVAVGATGSAFVSYQQAFVLSRSARRSCSAMADGTRILKQTPVFDTSKKQVFVIGNEAADVDSLVSAYTTAALLDSDEVQGVALAQIAREEFRLRGDALLLFKQAASDVTADGSPIRLHFWDDIDWDAVSQLERRSLVLTDHNRIDSKVQEYFDDRVVQIFDHHVNTNSHPSAKAEIDEGLGSTCSLIAEQYLATENEIPNEIATLLAGVILLDCRNFDPEQRKGTPRDRAAFDHLLASQVLSALTPPAPGAEVTELATVWYNELYQARKDVSHLSLRELLMLDLKAMNTSDGHIIGFCSIFRTLHQVSDEPLGPAGVIEECQRFAVDKGYEVVVGLYDRDKEGRKGISIVPRTASSHATDICDRLERQLLLAPDEIGGTFRENPLFQTQGILQHGFEMQQQEALQPLRAFTLRGTSTRKTVMPFAMSAL